jgi:uncharacterized damage-inducible protein DinB
MSIPRQTEFWQRGPVENIPALLQPVAHALLQAQAELRFYLEELPPGLLWERPAGLAAAGFHVLHITGVLDRLFTYARGEQLTEAQLEYLSAETQVTPALPALLEALDTQVDRCLAQLQDTNPAALATERYVGRKKISTTLGGLLFHAAEHTMRHTGQLLVTATVVKAHYLP